MRISFECTNHNLIELLDIYELEDRDFALSTFLYHGFLDFLYFYLHNNNYNKEVNHES